MVGDITIMTQYGRGMDIDRLDPKQSNEVKGFKKNPEGIGTKILRHLSQKIYSEPIPSIMATSQGKANGQNL